MDAPESIGTTSVIASTLNADLMSRPNAIRSRAGRNFAAERFRWSRRFCLDGIKEIEWYPCDITATPLR